MIKQIGIILALMLVVGLTLGASSAATYNQGGKTVYYKSTTKYVYTWKTVTTSTTVATNYITKTKYNKVKGKWVKKEYTTVTSQYKKINRNKIQNIVVVVWDGEQSGVTGYISTTNTALGHATWSLDGDVRYA